MVYKVLYQTSNGAGVSRVTTDINEAIKYAERYKVDILDNETNEVLYCSTWVKDGNLFDYKITGGKYNGIMQRV